MTIDPAAAWLVVRLLTHEVADLSARSRVHEHKVRFRWNPDRTVDVVDPPAWAVTWLESRRGEPLPELQGAKEWMCFYCNDVFDGEDDDRPPVCLMCRKAHVFAFEPGTRVRHKRLAHFGEGTISTFQPDLHQGVVYVAWDHISPGVPGSGRSRTGLPCPDKTLGHGWKSLQPAADHA